MLSKWKLSVLAVCGVFCSVSGFTAFADTEAATEAAAEPEIVTSGEYTYYIDEEYEGAVLTAYEPDTPEVTIPEEIDGNPVVGLENFLFNNQVEIEKMTIPTTLLHIGASAFYGTSIKEFVVEEGHTAYKAEDGVLFSKDGIALVAYPPGKEDTSYVVPEGVEEIYHSSFASCDYLHELTLPDSLIYVDTWAFAYTPLKKLEITGEVTQLSAYACAYMQQLEEVILPDSLLTIQSAAFAGCGQLKTITLPQGLVEIGQGAFAGAGLKSIVIPPSVETIGYCALGYQSDMETVNSNFVIYGLTGSAAQTYATDSDDEYDYENNFTFIAKSEEALTAGIELDEEGKEVKSADEQAEVVVQTEKEETGSKTILKIVLMVLGGVVLCGGIGAVALSSRKKKKD